MKSDPEIKTVLFSCILFFFTSEKNSCFHNTSCNSTVKTSVHILASFYKCFVLGAWCYTSDLLGRDLCYVPDCEKDESRIVLVTNDNCRTHTYILPNWRVKGYFFYVFCNSNNILLLLKPARYIIPLI